jgi:serine/threonine-protein kinase
MLKKFSGSILYILITLLVISLYVDHHDLLENLEQSIQDTMFKLRGQRDVAGDIAIVGIDDRTVGLVGKWPWSREKVARLVDAISNQGPRTIVLDMTFAPDEYQQSVGYNDSLAAAFSRAGNVVFGFHYSQNDPASGLLLPNGIMKSALRRFDNQSAFAQYPPPAAARLHPPDGALVDAADYVGFVNVSIDNDRKVRWQPLMVSFRGEFFPSIHIAAAASYLGLKQHDLQIRVGTGISMGSQLIPTDSRGQMNVNFVGPAGTYKMFSAADLLNKQISPHELTGKMVLVGFTASGATNKYSTPVGSSLPGLELNANIIENILHDSVLRGNSGKVNINLFILIAIGVFCALILPKISLINRIAVLVIFLVVLLNLNYILFTTFNQVTRTFYPALEIVFFLAAAPIIKTTKESKAEDDDDEDEVDYESLLSSGRGSGIQDRTAHVATQSTFNQTAGKRTSISSGTGTMYISPATAPLGQKETAPTSVATLEPPPTDHFGRYRILRAIGKGAMGMVYQGLDPAIDRSVALKTIRVDQGADPQETEELRERLTREAKAAGKISHPNIVTIYDVGEENGMQYVAMEYLEGNTLENLLRRGIDWDYRTISKVMIQTCEALDYAHENGIVHRDIKPANIMILEGNKVKVMDFGIARVERSASLTQTGTALGTPNYISPEQLKGQPVDRRSDIFSLGVVFYEVLTHEKPFKGDTISALIYSILHTDPPRPSETNLDIPRIFDKIIAKALVKDPDLRFQRAKDIADILRKLI